MQTSVGSKYVRTKRCSSRKYLSGCSCFITPIACVCLNIALAVSNSRSSIISSTIYHKSPPKKSYLLSNSKSQNPNQNSYLLIEVLKLLPRELELGHLRQDHVPSPAVDVGDEGLEAVYGVQRHLALVLQGLKGLLERVFLAKLEDYLYHAAKRRVFYGFLRGELGRRKGFRV